MKWKGDGRGDWDVGGVAKNISGGVGGDGVTALEDFQRAAFLQLQRQAFPPLAFRAQQTFFARAQFLGEPLKAQSQDPDFGSKIEGRYAQARVVQALARIL